MRSWQYSIKYSGNVNVIYLNIILNTLIHISNYYLQQFMCLYIVFLVFSVMANIDFEVLGSDLKVLAHWTPNWVKVSQIPWFTIFVSLQSSVSLTVCDWITLSYCIRNKCVCFAICDLMLLKTTINKSLDSTLINYRSITHLGCIISISFIITN